MLGINYRMSPGNIAGWSVAICVLSGAISLADAPADRFAGQIQAYQDAASARQNDLANTGTLAAQAPGFTKTDMLTITAWINEETATWNKAADALKKGDEAGANVLARHAQELESKNATWNERINWRLRQAQINEYLPAAEESQDAVGEGRTEPDMKTIEAFMEAKKRRSEAYGRLADATSPTGDPVLQAKLKDQIDELDIDVEVENMKLGWVRQDQYDRMYVINDPKATSPELSAALQNILDFRKHVEDMYRQNRRAQRELEHQKQNYDALIAARNDAFKAARDAKDAREKASQPK